MSEKRFRFLIFAFLLTLAIQATFLFLRGNLPVTDGPPAELAATARSIWHREDISRADYYALKNKLVSLSNEDGKSYWQDVFILGKDQRLLPKHCLFFSMLAAIFYGIFGELGFWIFNLSLALTLSCSIYFFSADLLGQRLARTSALISIIGTQFFVHSYSFSYDLLAASLVLAGLALLKRFPAIAAFLLSSSALVRISCLVFIPLLFINNQQKHSYTKIILGIFGSFILFALLNHLSFGEIFSTPYHHLAYITNGQIRIDNFSHYLSYKVLISDWIEKLFSKDVGLILYNPGLILAAISIFNIIRSKEIDHKAKFKIAALALTSLFYIFLTFSYSMWRVSSPGNRFMLPAIFILTSLSGAVIVRQKSSP